MSGKGKKAAGSASHTVVLASQADIRAISECRDRLQQALTAEGLVTIDASEVESVDTATLQMLIAFRNTLRKRAVSVVWNKPSDVFRDMASLANLSDYLGLGDEAEIEDDGLCPVF